MDESGRILDAWLPALPTRAEEPAKPLEPVAALEWGASLVVADRAGRVVWLDRKSGEPSRVLREDVDGEALGLISDLVALTSGGMLLADTLGTRVHEVDAAGQPISWFGRFGTWSGTLQKPKSLALTPAGDVLVADSAVPAIQIFSKSGRFLGAVAGPDGPLALEHAIAIRAVPGASLEFLALDAAVPQVSRFRLDAASLDRARKRAQTRTLRKEFPRTARSSIEREAARCRQCHDGFVNDDREVWDPRKEHHPVDVVPERELPAFFPLTEDGRITCATCHSAHGVVSPEDAERVKTGEERLRLLRHSSQGRLFTRLTVEDSALCVACHSADAHEDVLSGMGPAGGAHPVGEELKEAMAARPRAAPAVSGGVADTAAAPSALNLEGNCAGCHSPHGAGTEPLLRSADDSLICEPCHAEHTRPAENHPLHVRPGRDVPQPRAGARLLVARDGGAACRTCHDLVGGAGDALLRSPADGGLLCIACHDERKSLPDSPHWRAPPSNGIPCLGCHDVHGQPQSDHLLHTMDDVAEPLPGDPHGCRSCHAAGARFARDGADPGVDGHPVLGETESGKKLESCLDCHDPHLADKPDERRCGECHAEQGAAQKRGGHGGAACGDCHPAHSHASWDGARRGELNPSSARCLSCHAAGGGAEEGVPVVSDYEHPEPVFLPDGRRWTPLGDLPLYGEDGERVAAGRNGDLGCESCHLLHGPDEKQPGTKLRRPAWKAACGACHGADALRFYLYFHEPERRGRGATP
jgi:predicted CXXCH cytochrome family protein